MSGHSKWSSIKHKKALTDAKKGKVFSKLANVISVSARNGDDPSMNPALRLAIEKAKSAEMPTVNIQRAIDRGSGKNGAVDLKEVTYEVYGPGGVGLIVEVISDNPVRTIAEIRAVLNRNNSKLAENGAVSFQFTRVGEIVIGKDILNDEFELELIDQGVEEINKKEDVAIICCKLDKLNSLIKYIETKKIEIADSRIIFKPNNLINLSSEDQDKLTKLIDELESLDDISGIYINCIIIY